ncbi:MlaD family protein [Pseudonocardia sp. Cha107L01]|uniref:MlaD family protein n=1 Tax=Pseudonocardia sp. Cha107L01 TaxID=3457576 RepID=UPI00403E77D3
MRIFQTFFGRMVVLGVFLFVSLSMFMYMLLQTGIQVPLLKETPKTLTMYTPNIDNLVAASQVQIAGVRVGEVLSSDATPQGGQVIFRVDSAQWPLHQGVKVRIGQRSLVGESYLDIKDGTGAPIAEGSTLPSDTVVPVVNLYDVYNSLDAGTRTEASQMLQGLGASTMQTKDQVSQTFDGLTALGRGGHNAIDAIVAQSQDLRELTGDTATLLNALDTNQGQIARMVSAANRVTQATAGQHEALEDSLRLLPTTEDRARDASHSLTELAGHLRPVARDLREAGPKLSDALDELPDTTKDLRGLMPSASDVLDRAPRTLDKVGDFSDDVDHIIDPARDVLADVNPVVGYLRPYGPDLAAFFANFNAALRPHDEAGRFNIRAMLFINEKTLTSPIPLSVGMYVNPFPKAGAGNNPGPFVGNYPRVEREGR